MRVRIPFPLTSNTQLNNQLNSLRHSQHNRLDQKKSKYYLYNNNSQ